MNLSSDVMLWRTLAKQAFCVGCLWMFFPWVDNLPQIRTKFEEVTFEQFGCKGNGVDETKMISQAFLYAKEHQLPIHLQGKTYIFSPGATVDITGIPAITGTGTLDLSNTGKSAGNPRMTAVFHVEGKKKFLQGGKAVVAGSSEVTLDRNLPLAKNDILFIASSEPLSSRKRDYYCKGQRATVSEYDPIDWCGQTKHSFLLFN